MLIRLSKRTARGKQLIRDCGNVWRVIKKSDIVAFSDKAPIWMFAEPTEDGHPDASRWIHHSLDIHFSVEIINE